MSWWTWKKQRVPEVISKLQLLDLLPYSKTDPLIFDREYRLPTDDEVLAVLGSDYSAFESETNDCDDYAFRAKGLVAGKGWPLAVCWINRNHLINAWLNDQRKWVWFEAQIRKTYTGKIESVDALII